MDARQQENQRRLKRQLLVAIGAVSLLFLLVIVPAVAWNFYAIRTPLKWWVRSQRYKAEVLAQPPTVGELKHIEWDGWGWAGQDTTVYLVFDPNDSLLTAARNHAHGKFKGIPCEVAGVSQLDTHWYAVQFYTNEFWGQRNELDCRGVTP